MKNIFVVVSMLSGVAIAGDMKVAFKSDISDKARLHSAALTEIFVAKKLSANGLSRLRFETVPGLEEARKNCGICLHIENINRLLKQAPLVKKSKENNTEEFYAENCPQELYQDMPDDMLADLLAAAQNYAQVDAGDAQE